jgi:hypothetical protein
MFKGKKGIYFLIPINILIWGFFIYRFYSAYHETDEVIVSDNLPSIKLDDLKESITYKLRLNYDDPFLKKEVKQKKANSNQQNIGIQQKAVVVKTPTVASQAPIIKYLGLVKNSSSGVGTAIVSINGQSRIIKQNETVEGVLFKSFDSNELIATWGKEKIVVKK